MSKNMHLGLAIFINIYRLIAPFFTLVFISLSPAVVIVTAMLIYLLPLLVLLFVPVYCFKLGCPGYLYISTDRISFWSVEYRYKCESCEAVHRAKIFDPNIQVTAEFS